MDGQSRTEIAGAILTRQLATLESIGHKDGAREAMERILEDLLSVYDASSAPVQRARVLVTALSVSWRDGPRDGPDASTQLDVDRMGQEALALLAREVSGVSVLRARARVESVLVQMPESERLASLVPQLTLSANMWLALDAYRRSPAGAEMMNAVAMHVEAAYNVLSGLLSGSESKAVLEASPKGKSAGAGSGTKAPRAINGASKKGRSAVDGTAKSGKKTAGDVTKLQPRKGDGIVETMRVLFC